MIYPEIELAQSIIEICKSKHINTIIISPGSRNAPLTLGFASNPYFDCYSIADERCAAFFAMGMAQQLGTPTALVCTSGSALLNYYPAIAEAFYSQIPLVVISADRPSDKIDIGDGQTIRQRDVFDNHIIYNANLSEGSTSENDRMIQEAIHLARTQKGPVHINAPFEEPLYNTVEQPTIQIVQHEFQKNPSLAVDLASYAKKWKAFDKKIVLVGVCPPHTLEAEMIALLAADPTVVVMTEVTSNLHHSRFVSNIDTLITPFTEVEFEKLQPQLLVTFGGMIVSKRVKAFLRKYQPENHWHIDELRFYDTFQCLTDRIAAAPNVFFKAVLPLVCTTATTSPYKQWIEDLQRERERAHQAFLEKAEFSDMKAFELFLPLLPKESQLQISNSSAIRYAQLFPIDPSVEVFCNRGTSGIDGSTSTSIGAAVASKKPNVLITGDIGFFYDSNALWNEYIPKDYKIVLINNQGGGIFRILPGHQESPVFNKFFETTHQYTAQQLTDMFGFAYYKAATLEELKHQAEAFFKFNQGPCLLEIQTPTKENNQILQDYFKNLVK